MPQPALGSKDFPRDHQRVSRHFPPLTCKGFPVSWVSMTGSTLRRIGSTVNKMKRTLYILALNNDERAHRACRAQPVCCHMWPGKAKVGYNLRHRNCIVMATRLLGCGPSTEGLMWLRIKSTCQLYHGYVGLLLDSS
jgi:hypothetical protein